MNIGFLENASKEIGYSSAMLACLMQEFSEGEPALETMILKEAPALSWQTHAARWLILSLHNELELHKCKGENVSDTAGQLLAIHELLEKIDRGDCPGRILKDIARNTTRAMDYFIAQQFKKAEFTKADLNALKDERNSMGQSIEQLWISYEHEELNNGILVKLSSPMHFIFERCFPTIRNIIRDNIPLYMLWDESNEAEARWHENEEQHNDSYISELDCYNLYGHVSDDSLWNELKKQFKEDFFDFGYMREFNGSRMFGLESAHAGILIGTLELIRLATEQADITDKLPLVMQHSFQLPDLIDQQHKQSQRLLESIG